jgi:hypothetical protein
MCLAGDAVHVTADIDQSNKYPQHFMITRFNSIAILTVLSALPATAAITVQHLWTLGETSAVTDSVGGATLTAVGTTVSVPGIASATAQAFTNTPSENPATEYFKYTGALSPSVVGSTNWGLDFYVKPDFLPDGTNNFEVGLVHLGGTGGNSLALELGHNSAWADGTINWMIQQPGSSVTNLNVSNGGLQPPVLGTWSHIVYVDNGGTGEFYVDGVKSTVAVPGVTGPDSSGNLPGLAIGSMWSNYRRGFVGDMDQVRVFTFPEPSALALVGFAAVGLLRRRR